MGLFKSSDKATDGDKGEKKSLYRRYQDSKRGEPISDADLLKYTGKTREQFDSWKDTQAGVGRNQLAGTLAMGNAAGLGGVATGAGYGGWGPGAAPNYPNRGMKFPPQQQKSDKEKALEDSD
ncbi:hypothetical protein ISF_03004 [Cordyceps fumosorosea ARSEF 2679]|uniref:Uncharacterized protein n=1 Tax=Cordyceps fumosorosea (strain ARSEF 2679) TaxID=1081104 RepID=A0A162LF32_CORFA|nr:hypothetical protein ISF_03004 [Cordyceps fumosorosea ARSEF 2679]OAA69734.1 hypothetical protein ISF_03004 [Cordyceps fumosorosea ARSEF 2679]